MNTKLLGRWGESLAADYLAGKGYKISAMSYHSRYGEIDVVAETKREVIFVEVKLRRSFRVAEAREYVDRKKQERIMLTAEMWLSDTGSVKQPRFDVIEIYAPEGTNTIKPEIIHIENAFWQEN